jgi:hypothetical protein
MLTLDVTSNIVIPMFQQLLTDLRSSATSIGFVIQGTVVKPEVDLLREKLSSALLTDDHRSKRPGTTLVSGHARVLEYQAMPATIDLIANFTGGIFSTGNDPSLPQDVFMRSSAHVVLETVSHENYAYIRIGEITRFLQHLLDERILEISA